MHAAKRQAGITLFCRRGRVVFGTDREDPRSRVAFDRREFVDVLVATANIDRELVADVKCQVGKKAREVDLLGNGVEALRLADAGAEAR